MNEIIGWSYKTSLHQNWYHDGLTIAVIAHLDGPDGKWKYLETAFIPGTVYTYADVVEAVRGLIWSIAREVVTNPEKHYLQYAVERGFITLHEAIARGFIVPEETQ